MSGDAQRGHFERVERARTALHDMRIECAEMVAEASGEVDPETRFLLGLINLLEMAVDHAAGVEAWNEEADRPNQIEHRREWPLALDVIAAWEEAHTDEAPS